MSTFEEMNNNQEMENLAQEQEKEQVFTVPEFTAPVYPAEQIPTPAQVFENPAEAKKPFDWVTFGKGVVTGIATGVTAMKLGIETKKKIQEKKDKPKKKLTLQWPIAFKEVENQVNAPAPEPNVSENKTPESNVQNNS